jgi:hypothetical protein
MNPVGFDQPVNGPRACARQLYRLIEGSQGLSLDAHIAMNLSDSLRFSNDVYFAGSNYRTGLSYLSFGWSRHVGPLIEAPARKRQRGFFVSITVVLSIAPVNGLAYNGAIAADKPDSFIGPLEPTQLTLSGGGKSLRNRDLSVIKK